MERLKTVDFAKGISIFAIVVIHAVGCQPSITSDSVASNPFIDFAYMALLLFFVFTGYFYNPEKSARTNIAKRLIQITLVSSVLLLIFPAVLCAYFLILGIPVTFNDYAQSLWLLVGGSNVFQSIDAFMDTIICGVYPGFYFVQLIIISYMIFYPTANYVTKSWKTLAAGVLITASVTVILVGAVGLKLPFYAHLAPLATAFMYVGAYIKKYNLFEYIDTHRKDKNYWLIVLALAVAAGLLLVFLPPGHGFDVSYFGKYGALSVYPFLVTALICGYLLMVIFSLLTKVPVLSEAFVCVGKHTLLILLFHAFIIKLLLVPSFGVTNESWFPATTLSAAVIAGILAVIIPVLVAEGVPRLRKRLSQKNKTEL